MRKSDETSYMLGLFSGILADIRNDIPSLGKELDRDWLRLSLLVEKKGLWFLTADLPELGKHFDQCLAASSFTKSGLVASAPFRTKGIIPRLFRGLYLRVFDELGLLRSDYDILSIRYLRQLFQAAKKYEKECTNERIYESVDEFFEVERSLRLPTLSWDADFLAADHLLYGRSSAGFGLQPDLPLERSGIESIGDAGASFTSREVRDAGPEPLCLETGKIGFWDHPTYLTSHPRDLDDHGGVKEEGPSIGARELKVLQEVADIISSCMGFFDPLQWRTKHGPGAVADKKVASKYSFPTWPAKLENVFPQADFAHANYGLWSDYLIHQSGKRRESFSLHEPPSRLLAVPKTQKGPRLIASEPISHQWCQQALKDYFDVRVSRSNLISRAVSFHDQTRNQVLAQRASLDGSFWTIDLSSASDRMSCWVVERFFRRNVSLLKALHASRTRWIFNSIGGVKNPTYHRLRKFSTMGSACTFPVQTIVFCGIAVTSVLLVRNIRPSIRAIREICREVRVFGDDIIVPDDAGYVCVALLTNLGFKINPSKTFGVGRFRESCGVDAFNGVDVTPNRVVKIPRRTAPESVDSGVKLHNHFVRSYMPFTASYLKSRIPRGFNIPEVCVGSGTFGYWTHGLPCNDHLPVRVNKLTQVREYLVHIPIGRCTKVPDEGDSSLLQYFTEAPSPQEMWSAGVVTRPTLKLRRRWKGC